MTAQDFTATIVASQDAALARRLTVLAAESRAVFVAGLPGTGKSLVIRELARTAAAAGRMVHAVQWDVARPVFEAAPAGRRYPLAAGVTHVVIRRAAGLWVREAIAGWDRTHPGADHLLIGELPLAGGRFIECARPADDAAEALLASPACRFVIPVPSGAVRAFIEGERDRRMTDPRHPREREDAPSHVLRALWAELVRVADMLGVPAGKGAGPAVPYDPAVYEAVYLKVLSARRAEALPLTRVLDVGGASVYDLGVPATDLLPSSTDVAGAIEAVEARYPATERLAEEMDRWYLPA